MATLLDLESTGHLWRITVRLDRGQHPTRVLYGTPSFKDWIGRDLPSQCSNWNLDETPSQQMINLAIDFISGGPMQLDRRFKPWWRTDKGVWYLKTADLRIFGWFPCRDHFIAACADTAHRIKTGRLYQSYVAQVIQVRDAMPLDDPKYVAGGDADVVLPARN